MELNHSLYNDVYYAAVAAAGSVNLAINAHYQLVNDKRLAKALDDIRTATDEYDISEKLKLIDRARHLLGQHLCRDVMTDTEKEQLENTLKELDIAHEKLFAATMF